MTIRIASLVLEMKFGSNESLKNPGLTGVLMIVIV